MTDLILPPYVNRLWAPAVAVLMQCTVVEGDWNGTPHWLGTRYLNARGYCFAPRPGKQRPNMAHRTGQEAFVGPIPEGYEVDHLCLVKACWNPAHTEAVTPAENQRRRNEVYRAEVCVNGHPMVGDNVATFWWNDHNKTVCKTCYLARNPNSGLFDARAEVDAYDSDGNLIVCKHGHPLSGDNLRTWVNRKGTVCRVCITCRTKKRGKRRAKTAA